MQYTAFESLLEEYDYQDEDKWCEMDLLAFKASTDPDTMYHHQAMKEPDRNKFLKAMQDECTAHYKEEHTNSSRKLTCQVEYHYYPVYGK